MAWAVFACFMDLKPLLHAIQTVRDAPYRALRRFETQIRCWQHEFQKPVLSDQIAISSAGC